MLIFPIHGPDHPNVHPGQRTSALEHLTLLNCKPCPLPPEHAYKMTWDYLTQQFLSGLCKESKPWVSFPTPCVLLSSTVET